MNVIINNRAGGNAPMIAQEAGKRFLTLIIYCFLACKGLYYYTSCGKMWP
jgi:hypothetical protein